MPYWNTIENMPEWMRKIRDFEGWEFEASSLEFSDQRGQATHHSFVMHTSKTPHACNFVMVWGYSFFGNLDFVKHKLQKGNPKS